MDQIKQGSIAVKEKNLKYLPDTIKIRIISLPKSDTRFYYYPIYNLLAINQDNAIQFYSIKENGIINNNELTEYFSKLFDKKYKIQLEHTLYLEDVYYQRTQNNILKFYIDDQSRYKLFHTFQNKQIWKYSQISKHSFMANMWIDYKLRIYDLSKFKAKRSIITKNFIGSRICFKNLALIRLDRDVCYLNIQTNKIIRKLNRVSGVLHALNSDYLFVPTQKWIGNMHQLATVKIYYICSMKIKGILKVKPRKYKFLRYLFIKELNVLTILYSQTIDFYNLATLEFLGSQILNEDYSEKIYYDEINGLTLFKKQNTWNL